MNKYNSRFMDGLLDVCPQGNTAFEDWFLVSSGGLAWPARAFFIPENPRNIAAENPPAIFRFGDAFSREKLSFANAGAVPVA